MQAMILAAGFGTRLLPHTRVRPKPLFPLLNTPLLLAAIERLQRCGFDHILVNCHHLREQVVAAVAGLAGVVVQEEETILGTGGGLRRALNSLRDQPLLVVNGDIYHTVELDRLYREHSASGRQVTLALHDFPRFNNVQVAGGRVMGFARRQLADGLAFTGIQVLDPALLEPLADHAFSCIIEYYRTLLASGETPIGFSRCDQCFWTDIGTPGDYLALHRGLLTGSVPRWPELGEAVGPFVVDGQASLAKGVRLLDWAAIGRASIGEGAVVQGSVIWDGVELAAGSWVSDSLLTPASASGG